MDSALPLITIKIEGGDTKQERAVASPFMKDTEDSPGEGSTGLSGAKNAVRKLVSFGTAWHVASKLVQNWASTVTLRTGAREYEQRLQFGMQIANSALNIGMSVMAGASVGGPIGAGAALALYAINASIDMFQRNREVGIKENREDISMGMARMRAGFVSPVVSDGRRGE